jgi:hypothetical protein
VEKGEVGVISVQFIALIISLLVLSNFTHVTDRYSTPNLQNVYWGQPSGHVQLTKGGSNTETVNASDMYVYFTLAQGTTASSLSASRLCNNAPPSGEGEQDTYDQIVINYTTPTSGYFFFGSTEQSLGETCTYSMQLTDSLQQVTNFVATVTLKAPTTSTNTSSSSTSSTSDLTSSSTAAS